MSADSPNIFNALFDLHPAEKHLQNENYLSEAFAYILQTVPGACEAWVTKIAKGEVWLSSEPKITTRKSEEGDEPGSRWYPDLKIEAQTKSGNSVTVWEEHKWGERCDSEQLSEQLMKYGRKAQKDPGALLAFVGAYPKQVEAAKQAKAPGHWTYLLWEDAYDVLKNKKLQCDDAMLKQLLNFMEAKGLSPGEPITCEQMQAYVKSHDFIPRLKRYGEKLKAEYSWERIPERYRNNPFVSDRDGRVSIWFGAPDWSSAIFVGFLCDAEKHEVSFTARDQGIDLMLIIWCDPRPNPRPTTALAALQDKAQVLQALGARVLLKGDRGNRGDYILLISQVSLASVIEGKFTEREQVEAIHSKLSEWLDTLFKDGKLEPALETLKGQPV